MVSAMELAYFVISKCSLDDYPISNLQLQKILFFIQKDRLKKGGWYIKDDFEAWPYGPVISSVYERFCVYGAMPIDEELPYHLNNIVINDIVTIVEKLREMDPWKLVEKTHKKGGSWDEVYKNGDGYKKIIPKSLIQCKG